VTADDDTRAAWWRRELQNTRIVLEQTNSSDRGAGGSAFSQKERFLDLLEGGRFRLLIRTFTNVSYAGMSVGGPTSRERTGTWDVTVKADEASLTLTMDNGHVNSYPIRERGRGVIEYDGDDHRWTAL
jgi:hypothetical protein